MDRRLFVDNLGPATTVEALTELFRTAGSVDSVTIPPSQSSASPNHAFIEMTSDYEAKQAVLLLNDTEWNGQRLTVTHAGPNNRRAAGFTGGGVHLTRRKVQK